MGIYISEVVHSAARAVRRTAWLYAILAALPIGCVAAVDASRPGGYPDWPIILTLFGGGFGTPAVLLFVLAAFIDRGSLVATVGAMLAGVLPALFILAAFFGAKLAGNPGGLLCPVALTLPSMYAISRCWDAVSELRHARRRNASAGFQPIVPSRPDPAARPTILPPRPNSAPAKRQPDRRPPSAT